MKKILLKKIIPITVVIFLTGVTFGLGFYFGDNQNREALSVNNVDNKDSVLKTTSANFNNFWKVWNLLDEKYVSPNEVSNQEKVWGAIQGLTASYKDPYTVFMPPTEAKSF